jgi:Na+/phosphate symporter
MSWILVFQWPAGIGLLLYGLMIWARGMDQLCGAHFAAWSEKVRASSPLHFFLGILAGSVLQGNCSLQYIKRRYLAGYLSPVMAIVTSCGMALGLFLPACMILTQESYWAYVLLVTGMALQFVAPRAVGKSLGGAILGLGFCWLGFSFCKTAIMAPIIVHYAFLVALVVSVATLMPSAVLLVVASFPDPIWRSWGMLLGVGGCLALSWFFFVIWNLQHLQRPFEPALSLLRRFDLAFPERALQAAMQEIHRMAVGIARVAHVLAEGEAPTRDKQRLVENVERSLDEFKPATRRYLLHLTRYQLDERQANVVMSLFIGISDIERISDHLLTVAMSLPSVGDRGRLPGSVNGAIDTLLQALAAMLDGVVPVITGSRSRKTSAAVQFEEHQNHAEHMLDHFSSVLQDVMRQKHLSPHLAIRMEALRSHVERLIRHVRAIVESDREGEYWIDPDVIHQEGHVASRRAAAMHISSSGIQRLLREYTNESD